MTPEQLQISPVSGDALPGPGLPSPAYVIRGLSSGTRRNVASVWANAEDVYRVGKWRP